MADFVPDRRPIYVEYCFNGQTIPEWKRQDPAAWMAGVEERAAPYDRMAIHLIGGAELGDNYGFNVRSIISDEVFELTCGVFARRWERGQRSGLYTGKKLQAPGVRSTQAVNGKALAEVKATAVATWEAMTREVAPFLKAAPEIDLWLDDKRGAELAQFNTLYGAFGLRVGGESWPFIDRDNRTLVDLVQARRAPYWCTWVRLEAADWSATWDADGNRVPGTEGGKLGRLDPTTTELHVMWQDWHFYRKDKGAWTPELIMPAAQMAGLVRGWQDRGVIVSGSSEWAEVQAAIMGQAQVGLGLPAAVQNEAKTFGTVG